MKPKNLGITPTGRLETGAAILAAAKVVDVTLVKERLGAFAVAHVGVEAVRAARGVVARLQLRLHRLQLGAGRGEIGLGVVARTHEIGGAAAIEEERAAAEQHGEQDVGDERVEAGAAIAPAPHLDDLADRLGELGQGRVVAAQGGLLLVEAATERVDIDRDLPERIVGVGVAGRRLSGGGHGRRLSTSPTIDQAPYFSVFTMPCWGGRRLLQCERPSLPPIGHG